MRLIPKSLSEWLMAQGFLPPKSQNLRGNRKQRSKGYVVESSTSENVDKETTESSPSEEELEAPTTRDLALVASLCRANASPGALRVANVLDKEVESRSDDNATDNA